MTLPDVPRAVGEDGEDMTTQFEQPAPPTAAPRPLLRRSRSDNVIAGVCGGFARWLAIDPVIVRVVLVVLAVFGGSGLVLYAVGWLFIPMEGSTMSVAEDFFRDPRQADSKWRTFFIITGAVIAVIIAGNLMGAAFGGWGNGGSILLLLAAGGVVLYLMKYQSTGNSAAPTAGSAVAEQPLASGDALAETTPYAYGGAGQYPGYVAPPATAVAVRPPRPRSYLGLVALSAAIVAVGALLAAEASGLISVPVVVIPAVALAILGLGILAGAWFGRARWLLWFAIPTLLVTVLVSFIPASFGNNVQRVVEAGIGERVWTPTNVVQASVPHTLGVGSAQLDLTTLSIPPNATSVPVNASVVVGELLVTVPAAVRVHVTALVNTGNLSINGVTSDKTRNVSFAGDLPGGPSTGPVLDLTLTTEVGNLEVSRA